MRPLSAQCSTLRRAIRASGFASENAISAAAVPPTAIDGRRRADALGDAGEEDEHEGSAQPERGGLGAESQAREPERVLVQV